MSIGLIVFLAVVVLIIFWFVAIYNRLVALRNRFKNAFAQIDVQLKRRYDLIPNLVETAKGYMAHERQTLEAVVAARNTAVSALSKASQSPESSEAVRALGGAETGLSSALGRLFALSESYPDLKANQTMSSLMEELTSTENKVGFARQSFNDTVMTYNTAREQFPNSMVAGMGNFQPAELLQIENPEERKAVKVSFS
jgi:LemA protein